MITEDQYKLYEVSYTKITNQSMVEGEDEYPVVPCVLSDAPDYLCLYKEVKDYNKTDNTCVFFYEYDSVFDGINGLFNAIYYDNKKLLEKYKNRFKNVKMIIEPDYSQVRDIEVIEQKYRQFKARVVGLWFLLEMHIPVIPNVNYAGENSFAYMLDGIHSAKMLAMSLKGILDKPKEEVLFKKVLKQVCDNTDVKTIVCYTTGIIQDKTNELFAYAHKKGINVVIPDNSWNIWNRRRKIEYLNQK